MIHLSFMWNVLPRPWISFEHWPFRRQISGGVWIIFQISKNCWDLHQQHHNPA
jgi:hypothetical protein